MSPAQTENRSSKGGSTLLAALTLVAVICFLALVIMQVLEFLFYG